MRILCAFSDLDSNQIVARIVVRKCYSNWGNTRVGDLKGAKIERPIELTHWHRAVAIVERWRASHHQLMAHIHTLDYTPPTAQAKLEQRLLKLIQRQPPTTRAMRNATRKSYEEVGRALTTLERADVIEKVEQGKTVVYRLRV